MSYAPWIRDLVVIPEVTEGTAVMPAATGGLLHSGLEFDPGRQKIESASFKNYRGGRGSIEGQRKPTGSIAWDWSPSGTAGTPPDCDDWLQTIFSVANTTQFTLDGSLAPTTTTATITPTGAVAAGDLIFFGVDSHVEARVVTKVSNTGGAIVWAPPLASAPSAGATIKACRNYTLQKTPTKSCTLHEITDTAFLRAITGAWAKGLTIEFSNDGSLVKCSTDFAAKDYCLGGPLTLGAAVETTDGTTFNFAADALAVPNETGNHVGMWYKCDNEVFKITAYDYATGNATVVRGQAGTSGATHLIGTACLPYTPTPTVNDYPQPSIRGFVWLGDTSATDWAIVRGKLVLDEAGEQRMAALKETPIGRVYAENRTATLELTMIVDSTVASLIGHEWMFNTLALIVQIGDQDGQSLAIRIPKAEVTLSQPVDEGSEVAYNMTCRCLPTSGNDEFGLGVA